jgi:hypothetical protein
MNVHIAAKRRESMPVEHNHMTTFREYLAALPEPDPTRLREKLAKVVAADFDGTDLPEPLRKQGREGLAIFRERANQAGATITVEQIFATGDKVVARMIGTFTPAGASEPFSFQLIEIAEIKTDGPDTGKIGRRWVEFDRTKVLQLLGMSPAQRA